MRDPVVVDRLRHETRESLPARRMPPETFLEAAEDTIVNWHTSDWADQMRDLDNFSLAHIALYIFNAMRPDILNLNDMQQGSTEINVRSTVNRIIREQAALAQEDWEARS